MGKQGTSDLCTYETDPTLTPSECQVIPHSTWTHNDNECQRLTGRGRNDGTKCKRQHLLKTHNNKAEPRTFCFPSRHRYKTPAGLRSLLDPLTFARNIITAISRLHFMTGLGPNHHPPTTTTTPCIGALILTGCDICYPFLFQTSKSIQDCAHLKGLSGQAMETSCALLSRGWCVDGADSSDLGYQYHQRHLKTVVEYVRSYMFVVL